VRQSGIGLFRFARMPEDELLLTRARHHAEAIVAADPQLRAPEHVLLADALAARQSEPSVDAIAA
jgi:ATP-dependent DNA helicase RecG